MPGVASSSGGMGARKNSLANIFGLGSKQPTPLEPTPDAPKSQLSGLTAASSRSASMELTRTNSMSGGGGEDGSVRDGGGVDEYASRRERISGRDAPISGNAFTGNWTPLGQVKLFVVSCGKLVKMNKSGDDEETKSSPNNNVNNKNKAFMHQRTMEKLKSGSSTLHALFSEVSSSKEPPQHGDQGLSGLAHSASEALQKSDGDGDGDDSEREAPPAHITMGKEENTSDDHPSSSFDKMKDRRRSLGDNPTLRKSHEGTSNSGPGSISMVHSRSVEGIDSAVGQGVSNFSDDEDDAGEDQHPLTQHTTRF
jgi:hypothetical protein